MPTGCFQCPLPFCPPPSRKRLLRPHKLTLVCFRSSNRTCGMRSIPREKDSRTLWWQQQHLSFHGITLSGQEDVGVSPRGTQGASHGCPSGHGHYGLLCLWGGDPARDLRTLPDALPFFASTPGPPPGVGFCLSSELVCGVTFALGLFAFPFLSFLDVSFGTSAMSLCKKGRKKESRGEKPAEGNTEIKGTRVATVSTQVRGAGPRPHGCSDARSHLLKEAHEENSLPLLEQAGWEKYLPHFSRSRGPFSAQPDGHFCGLGAKYSACSRFEVLSVPLASSRPPSVDSWRRPAGPPSLLHLGLATESATPPPSTFPLAIPAGEKSQSPPGAP